jgi:hypothetical protein
MKKEAGVVHSHGVGIACREAVPSKSRGCQYKADMHKSRTLIPTVSAFVRLLVIIVRLPLAR